MSRITHSGGSAPPSLSAPLLALAAIVAASAPAWSLPPQSSGVSELRAAASRAGNDAAEGADSGIVTPENRVAQIAADRLSSDLIAIQFHRPSYPFWRHIYLIPDGQLAFGSAGDGRLLAVLPASADWRTGARFEEPSLAQLLRRQSPARTPEQRREQVARLISGEVGPVVQNPTRGRFFLPNADRYGSFLAEWSAIYERFGVPANVGLAQAIVESGWSGTVRSEARAIGLCQWLEGNWKKLNRLSPHVIEAANQTTQAPYCAAYLTVLATKYGSFLPALSEHHAGGANVGRAILSGARLGGSQIPEKYFRGSQFLLSARELPGRRYSELYGTYGPRSFRYTELVFGNLETVAAVRSSRPQAPVHAMRTTRNIPLAELANRSGLSTAELKRYNPALVRQVPARATVYLPSRVAAFGADVAFWRRPPNPQFAAALAEFMALSAPPETWDAEPFERVLGKFQQRFASTRSEEGTVMATVLAYVIEENRADRRGAILREYDSSERIAQLFSEAAAELALR